MLKLLLQESKIYNREEIKLLDKEKILLWKLAIL